MQVKLTATKFSNHTRYPEHFDTGGICVIWLRDYSLIKAVSSGRCLISVVMSNFPLNSTPKFLQTYAINVYM